MIVETLAVGTELLLGQIVNSNASTIGALLADAGLDHYHQMVVGDNVERVAADIQLALSRSDALIITGGIGPTQDDLTREAICLAVGVPMVRNDEYADRLRNWWERRGREMPESNLRQAHHPEGAELIRNPKGTAPGLKLKVGDRWVFAVPGVPAEMVPMVERDIVPFLMSESGVGGVVVSRLLRSWGESESKVGELLSDLYDEHRNPTVAFLASSGEIKIRLTAKASDEAAAYELIRPVESEVRNRMGSKIFGADDETIERVLFDGLAANGWSIATAESATGGMIVSRLTAIPGASEFVIGSVVAYDVAVKESVLDVSAALVAEHGVVSEPVAVAMADGAAKRLGADVVISVTGSAGPDPLGASVGTMVVGVHTPHGTKARSVHMPGDRERVRVYTTTAALHMARLAIAGEWWDALPERWTQPKAK
ncbi:MAG: competence/damage-inducible protein A [Acidimicrobiia bacterium]|nr:competence/damage-inducible protein A [Acidimicrobiia bacterium]